ncbi:aminotransferase class III-fold pyridoxal phosphate-dependent enzyme [Escherichia coli]
MCNFFAQSAENATLKDVEGNEYIDFAAGIAVLNTGHRHPDLVAAVEQQLQQFTHTAFSTASAPVVKNAVLACPLTGARALIFSASVT